MTGEAMSVEQQQTAVRGCRGRNLVELTARGRLACCLIALRKGRVQARVGRRAGALAGQS